MNNSRSELGFCHPIANIVYATKRNIESRMTRATIIYRVIDNTIEYQAVFTAPGDNFCRKEGRERAADKFTKAGPLVVETLSSDRPTEVIFGDICAKHLPSRWISAQFTIKHK